MRNETGSYSRLIIFVCSGNTCRSPMAEGFTNHFLETAKAGGDWRACSSGTMAADGIPANEMAVRVMAEHGIDISRHRSSYAGSWEPPAGTLFFGMARDHVNALKTLFPSSMGSIHLLGEAVRPWYSGTLTEVPDPFGASIESYREIAGLLKEMTLALMKRLTISSGSLS